MERVTIAWKDRINPPLMSLKSRDDLPLIILITRVHSPDCQGPELGERGMTVAVRGPPTTPHAPMPRQPWKKFLWPAFPKSTGNLGAQRG